MKKHIYSFLCLTIFFVTNAYGVVSLELTKGTRKSIPISIVPFEGSIAAKNLTQVIESDLARSGEFKVTPSNQLPDQPYTPEQINLAKWKKQPAPYVLVGSLKRATPQTYEVSFDLLNLYSGAPKTPILTKQFSTQHKPSDLRKLAHHISDLVYERLTGRKGVFSTHIAYVLVKNPFHKQRHYKLMLADADGQNVRTLLTSGMPIMSPAWSPDKKKIAYVSFEGGHAGIYIQDIASGHRRKISGQPGINGAPAWSPDGRKLAIVLTKTGHPKIYIFNVAGNQLTQITGGSSIDTEPTWSPDGQSIYFTSNRSGNPQIYRLRVSGLSAASAPEKVTRSGRNNYRPFITPDNQYLVFLKGGSGHNIAKQNLQTGKVTSLTHHGHAQSPSIAPNGHLFIYTINQKDHQMLAIGSMDGQIRIRMPSQQGNVREPAWSTF